MTTGGSTCCAPQGAERLHHIPSVFLSQWALLETSSSPRPSTRKVLLIGFCGRTCSPPRAGSRVMWQGLANFNSTEKAKAVFSFFQKLNTAAPAKSSWGLLFESLLLHNTSFHTALLIRGVYSLGPQRQRRTDNRTRRNILRALTAPCLNGLQLHSVDSGLGGCVAECLWVCR